MLLFCLYLRNRVSLGLLSKSHHKPEPLDDKNLILTVNSILAPKYYKAIGTCLRVWEGRALIVVVLLGAIGGM